MPTFHHVNLGVLPEQAEAETAFLVEVLGFQAVPAEESPNGARWFDADDGVQIHLSLDPEHRPAARAHVALVLGDALEEVADRLRKAGHEARSVEGFFQFPAYFTSDPAGNRWELRGTPAPSA
jgi:catechol 2,3-dioxygenase-like lactoylglutathione lyase family enzyme